MAVISFTGADPETTQTFFLPFTFSGTVTAPVSEPLFNLGIHTQAAAVGTPNASQLVVQYQNGWTGAFFGNFDGQTGYGTIDQAFLIDDQGHAAATFQYLNITTDDVANNTIAVGGSSTSFALAVLSGNDIILGGPAGSANTLSGGIGNDTLIAGAGSTTFIVGSGSDNDLIVGGSGATVVQNNAHTAVDWFVLGAGATTIQAAAGTTITVDAVANFHANIDRISISAQATGITSAAAALTHVQSDGHGNSVVTLGQQVLLLAGTPSTSLIAADFLIV